jgi:hypothetical protein
MKIELIGIDEECYNWCKLPTFQWVLSSCVCKLITHPSYVDEVDENDDKLMNKYDFHWRPQSTFVYDIVNNREISSGCWKLYVFHSVLFSILYFLFIYFIILIVFVVYYYLFIYLFICDLFICYLCVIIIFILILFLIINIVLILSIQLIDFN